MARVYNFNGQWINANNEKVVHRLNQETGEFVDIPTITQRHYLDILTLEGLQKQLNTANQQLDKQIEEDAKLSDCMATSKTIIKLKKEIKNYEQRIRKHEAKSSL